MVGPDRADKWNAISVNVTYQTLLCRFEGLGRELTGIVDLQIWKRAYSIYGSNRGKRKTTFCVY